MRFDGVANALTAGDLSAVFPTAATLLVVVQLNNATTYSVYGTRDNSDRWRYEGDGAGYFGVFRGTRLGAYPPAMPTSGTHLFTVRSSATHYEVSQDGTSFGAQAADHDGGSFHTLGSSPNVYDFLAGDLAEVLVYPAALSDAELLAAQNYLNLKYVIY